MRRNSVTRLCLLLVVACLVATAEAGDRWDDFANNLATDLAPLLALFGEQVTKQFLSESTTLLDNVIFAMAPLGILTAVVSAIRVCGSSSLRAFIGRVQEGGGIAEAELCSSTSRDVCELYHNGAIVRVFGRPKILEIIHDSDEVLKSPDSPPEPPDKHGIYPFREYIGRKSEDDAKWEELRGGAWKKFEKHPQPDPEDAVSKGEQASDSEDDEFAPNPNLSINIGIREPPRQVIRLAAAAGFLLQSSVVAFGFLATYKWRWEKEGNLPPAWAFPLMALGTLLLAMGMFSCAFLVENSTKERVFRRSLAKDEDSLGPTIYVVQPGNQTVGDQTFDSFAFTDASRPLRRYTTSWKVQQDAELGVWLATGMTMSGFVFQFVGLRGMHSAVSIAQLGAILLMSIIRAGLRSQRLRKDQNLLHDRRDEVEGHELDWLALQMVQEVEEKEKEKEKEKGSGKEGPEASGLGEEQPEKNEPEKRESRNKEAEKPKRKFWSVIGGPAKSFSPSGRDEPSPGVDGQQNANTQTTTQQNPQEEAGSQATTPEDSREEASNRATTQRDSQEETNDQTTKLHLARTAFFYRSRLAELTSQPAGVKSKSSVAWGEPLVHVRQQARQLKKAIESSADILFAYAEVKHDWKDKKCIPWDLNVVEYNHSEPGLGPKVASEIRLSLDRPKDGSSTAWEVSQHHLEAAVGLWTWSIISDPRTERDDISKLHVSKASEIPMSRIIAVGVSQEDIERARMDLKLWMEDFTSSSSVEKLAARPTDRGPDTLWKMKVEETLRDLAVGTSALGPRLRLYGWQIAPHDSPTEMFALTTPVTNSISAACAQDIYQSSLCAMAEVLDSIGGQITPSRGIQGFHFKNEVVSRLAECFRESSLGSIRDGYSVIIPALRRLSKLPLPEDGHQLVHRVAEQRRKEGNFQEAEDLLRWAWQTALATNGGQDNGVLSVAMLEATMLEFGELYRNARFRKDGPPEEVFSRKGISWMVEEAKKLRNDSIAVISARYASLVQRPVDPNATAEDLIVAMSTNDREKSLWLISMVKETVSVGQNGRTVLSWAAQQGWPEIVKAALEIGSVIDSEDKSKRTALSYAAEFGHAEVVRMLMRSGALPFTEDSDRRTPLSYAAAGGHVRVMKHLLNDSRVTTFTKDAKKRSPLHWAAENGSEDAIDLLLQHGATKTLNDPDHRRHTPLGIALLNKHLPVAVILVSRRAEVDILVNGTKAWKWAVTAGEWTCAKFLLGHLNMGNHQEKTSVILEMSRNPHRARSVSQSDPPESESRVYRLAWDGITWTAITTDILEGVAAGKFSMTAEFCEQQDRGPTTERWRLREVSWVEVMKLLLETQDEEAKVTEAVVEAAAGNEESGAEMMKLLLDLRAEEVNVTEAAVKEAVGNWKSGLVITKLLLEMPGEGVKVTEAVVKEVVGNWKSGVDIMKLLLELRGGEVKVSEAVIKGAAGNPWSGVEMMKLLLEMRGEEVKVTEAVVEEAAGNMRSAVEMTKLLLELRGEEVKITEAVVKGAAGNPWSGVEMMKLLLEMRGEEVNVTEAVVKAAAGNKKSGAEVMKLLLDIRGEDVKITEAGQGPVAT